MTEQEWFDEYRPRTNHLDSNSSFEGLLFETYGSELDYVKSQPNENIWTYVDGDDDSPLILNGYHLVNRIGYFVCANAWTEPQSVEIEAA